MCALKINNTILGVRNWLELTKTDKLFTYSKWNFVLTSGPGLLLVRNATTNIDRFTNEQAKYINATLHSGQ